jgi:hypothetical protein
MKFYQKHIPEGQRIEAVIHQHWLSVMDSFVLWLSFGALLPSFLYYQSERIRDLVPFYYMEILLFLVFFKIIYELFNWYNDVWIITDRALYDLEWSLLKTKVESIHHENIEWVEIDKHRIWDNIFNKGDIIVHKFGEEELAILGAYAPYKSVDILESFIHPADEAEEIDNFDMIMDTLWGVVTEYLDKHGHKHSEKREEFKPELPEYDDRYTLDARD